MENAEAQVQQVDSCRVEIKQAANGSIQVSTRATDRATEEEADRATEMALRMFSRTTEALR